MDYIQLYLDEKKLSKSPRTIINYRQCLRSFERFMHPTHMESVSKADIVRYFSTVLSGENAIEKSTAATYQVQLSTFYKWMYLEGYMKENPCARIDKINFDDKLPVYLTIEEIKSMLQAAKIQCPRDEMIIRTLYYTGIRVSELTNIRKKDLDFLNNRIKVFGKGAKERTVEVPAPYMADLEEYCRAFKLDQQLYEYHTGTVQRDIRIIAAQAGIKKHITPHKLRHSFATHMAQNNCNLEALRKLLGHTSLNTTQRYMHLGDKEIRDQVNATHPGFKGQV